MRIWEAGMEQLKRLFIFMIVTFAFQRFYFSMHTHTHGSAWLSSLSHGSRLSTLLSDLLLSETKNIHEPNSAQVFVSYHSLSLAPPSTHKLALNQAPGSKYPHHSTPDLTWKSFGLPPTHPMPKCMICPPEHSPVYSMSQLN